MTRSTFTGVFLCALGSNPAVAVFPKVCSGSKGDAKHFYWCFFVCVGFESCCCSAFSHAVFHGFQRFVVDPKVTRSTFTGVFLCALGSNPAAVPLFRMRFSMACWCLRVASVWHGLGFLRPFFQRFVVDPKVTRSIFTGVFLCALGSNPAAVPLFRGRSPSTFLL